MSNKQESIVRTVMVAFVMCLVCSVIVASAAVLLRPTQIENRLLDKQRYILEIAGLAQPGVSAGDVKRIFADRIQARVVDLRTGQFTTAHDAATFDPLQAAKDPAQSIGLHGAEDIASIHRRENETVVYVVEDDRKQLQTLILPVRGYGVWSTLHGFIALKADLNTVVGLGFYQHAETAGLGGEVDNPRWRALWPGKQVFADDGKPDIQIIKGTVDPSNPRAAHQVDGLAGASLTSQGVGNLLKFWLGPQGFGPFIAHLKDGSAKVAGTPVSGAAGQPDAAAPAAAHLTTSRARPQAAPRLPASGPELAARAAGSSHLTKAASLADAERVLAESICGPSSRKMIVAAEGGH